MNQVNRICPQCGGSVSLESRYCGSCGHDTSHGLPVQRLNLPVQVGKAALPVVAGLAGLAIRSGWKLLQSYLAQAATQTASAPQSPPVRRAASEIPPTQRAGRTIRIRSSWVIGDGQGRWKQGNEEHIIEIDD
ncbi:MAG: zinc ribbon domain-containing protein [Caldilineaceae bacterium]|nr:zinc ribbon domain-containing protein [Caldilineaceae bacterium]